MTQVKYSSTSVYGTTSQVSNILQYLDFWNPPSVPVSVNDQVVVLNSRYNNRPDLLSYDLYKTTAYWWVFMMRNPDVIKDPIWDFVTGIQIYAPVLSDLPRSGQ